MMAALGLGTAQAEPVLRAAKGIQHAFSLGEDGRVAVPTAHDPKVYITEAVGISRQTHDAHFRLWQSYANKTNEIRRLLEASPADPAQANQIYSEVRGLKVNYAFALGGYINHTVYFDGIGKLDQQPTGELAEVIADGFGSVQTWKRSLKATGIGARGWAYLAYSYDENRLTTLIGDAQDTFPMWDHALILALDVYEHAYYLDFQTRRGDYIDAYLRCLDWDALNARYRAALQHGAALA